MKTSWAIVAVAISVASAHAEIIFRGYMITAGRPQFVLSIDKEQTSGWYTLGQSFSGFTIVDFDVTTEVLTIEKDGKMRVLHLVRGKIQAPSESTSDIAVKPITVSIGTQGQIYVGGDVVPLGALKSRFVHIAATVPQPIIVIRSPSDFSSDRLGTILDHCKAAGLKRVSFGPRSALQEKHPEPSNSANGASRRG
jgi:biopolymer transport protein ExbD